MVEEIEKIAETSRICALFLKRISNMISLDSKLMLSIALKDTEKEHPTTPILENFKKLLDSLDEKQRLIFLSGMNAGLWKAIHILIRSRKETPI